MLQVDNNHNMIRNTRPGFPENNLLIPKIVELLESCCEPKQGLFIQLVYNISNRKSFA